MAANHIYKGFIIRDETLYQTAYTGSVNYYVKDYSKVACNDLIYSVDESGTVADKLNAAKQESTGVSNAVSEKIVKLLNDFETTYSQEDFYQTYALKEQINSILNEALSLEALAQISEYADYAEQNQTFHKVRSPKDGIVAYYVDGYEQVTVDSFQAGMLDEASYNRTNLRTSLKINAGSAAFKLINSEKWNIIFQISEELAAEMAEKLEKDQKKNEEKKLDNPSVVPIRFVKDGKEMYAAYELKEMDGAHYMVLNLTNSMVRYASDRYIEIELLLTEETGLKIPNTAITEKEFYTIPINYFLEEEETKSYRLCQESVDENGSPITKYISPTIYYQTEEYFYIDSEFVQAGEQILEPSTLEKYTIGTHIGTLQGVYNINKGYAVFKQIEILFQNEEYSIVETGTSYGIALYDHIALDGSKIAEDELLK